MSLTCKATCGHFTYCSGTAEWTRGRGHKLKNMKFHQNVRKSFSAVMVTENWRRLSWELEESPSLGMLQEGDGPEQTALADPAWARGVGQDSLERPLNLCCSWYVNAFFSVSCSVPLTITEGSRCQPLHLLVWEGRKCEDRHAFGYKLIACNAE